jgi:hypothetical protein
VPVLVFRVAVDFLFVVPRLFEVRPPVFVPVVLLFVVPRLFEVRPPVFVPVVLLLVLLLVRVVVVEALRLGVVRLAVLERRWVERLV